MSTFDLQKLVSILKGKSYSHRLRLFNNIGQYYTILAFISLKTYDNLYNYVNKITECYFNS